MEFKIIVSGKIDVNLHSDGQDRPKWADELIALINHRSDQIMKTLSDIQADVTAEDTVIDSAIALLKGLAAQVAALQPNQAAIDALAADIEAKTQALADAVVANTPA